MVKRATNTGQTIVPHVMTPIKFHEPFCACSKDFVRRNIELLENTGVVEGDYGFEPYSENEESGPGFEIESFDRPTSILTPLIQEPGSVKKRGDTVLLQQLNSFNVSIANLGLGTKTKSPQNGGTLPSLRSLFNDSPEIVSLSSPIPQRITFTSKPSQAPRPTSLPKKKPRQDEAITGEVANMTADSFFDQCEEEFRRGLKKKNIDRIVSTYEAVLNQGEA